MIIGLLNEQIEWITIAWNIEPNIAFIVLAVGHNRASDALCT
jgi:hypothetical protein